MSDRSHGCVGCSADLDQGSSKESRSHKVPITVVVGAPLHAGEDIAQADAALRESMTTLLHQVQQSYPHRARSTRCLTGWAAGHRLWPRRPGWTPTRPPLRPRPVASWRADPHSPGPDWRHVARSDVAAMLSATRDPAAGVLRGHCGPTDGDHGGGTRLCFA